MTWDAFHRRGEVLRNVLEHAETYRDGELPMELPGVAETFGDELTLLGALQLRWHTRLAGTIERELMGQPMDLEASVMTAWRKTATDLAGLRAILDGYTAAPLSGEMAQMLDKAHRKDWTLMAAMSGKASPADKAAPRVGRAIEQKAREAYRPRPSGSNLPGRRRAEAPTRQSLMKRVKAHLVA
ncbi:MAG TPA: hypothetical protein VLB29_08770 [Nocardioidaceae bacterium]|nr:hypothetical protein [Nocardioidaceae bacterium]